MNSTGTLSIDRAAGGDPGVVIARLYGPRGGYIGDTQLSEVDAREAYNRLRLFAGTPSTRADDCPFAVVEYLDKNGSPLDHAIVRGRFPDADDASAFIGNTFPNSRVVAGHYSIDGPQED